MSQNSTFNHKTVLNAQSNSLNLVCLIHYQTNTLPLAPVPNQLWFSIVDSRLDFPRTLVHTDPKTFLYPDQPYDVTPYKKSILLPEVDKVGTEFVKEMLPVRYTTRLIDFLSEKAGMQSSSSETDSAKVGYSVDIMKLFQKEDAGTLSVEYQKQLTKSLSYFLEGQARKHELETERFKLALKYKELVADTYYAEETKPNVLPLLKRLGDDYAQAFIERFNKDINDKLNAFFNEMGKLTKN